MDKGKTAEYVTWHWLNWIKSQGFFIDVLDVSEDKTYQKVDVDFICHWSNGLGEWSVETKSDGHLGQSGSILYELIRINHTGPTDKAVVVGWSTRSQADWFVYYSPLKHELYYCQPNNLRKAFQKYTEEARRESLYTGKRHWINTDSARSTINIYIAWKYCKEFIARTKVVPEWFNSL